MFISAISVSSKRNQSEAKAALDDLSLIPLLRSFASRGDFDFHAILVVSQDNKESSVAAFNLSAMRPTFEVLPIDLSFFANHRLSWTIANQKHLFPAGLNGPFLQIVKILLSKEPKVTLVQKTVIQPRSDFSDQIPLAVTNANLIFASEDLLFVLPQ